MNKRDSDKSPLTLTLSSNKIAPKTESLITRSGKKLTVVEVKKRGYKDKQTIDNSSKISTDKRDTSLTADEQNTRINALRSATRQAEIDKKEEEKKLELQSKDLLEKKQEITSKTEFSKNTEEIVQPIIPIESEDNINKKTEEKFSKNVKHVSSFPDDDETKLKTEVKYNFNKNKDDARRNIGRILINKVFEDDSRERSPSLASLMRKRAKAKKLTNNQTREKISKEIIIPEVITVQELANRMAERSADVIKELMKGGIFATSTQTIDADDAELVAYNLGHKVKRVAESDVENSLYQKPDEESTLLPRAPVVTIMGHVDHGKTSLLDALRSTDIASGEAGGITQHIGAYKVNLPNDLSITFLDTPGHEAFTAMRARGAKATDIVVLVVAADDGVMTQTIEAINHAKAASVPIIVAVNKIDKEGVDPNRVKEELLTHDLIVEDYGGDVISVEVSAKSKINLDKLEECILLQAEILNLRANPNKNATGVVIESKIDKGKGVLTTLLIQNGTLKSGDLIIAGNSYGKVRAMYDDKNKLISHALPSMPVEILGLSITPAAGESFAVVNSEKQAREIIEFRIKKEKDLRTTALKVGSLEELFLRSNSNKNKELALIIKTDVQGSLEAISGSLEKLVHSEVRIKIIHQAVGGINESDISLAKASNAMILGFNVRADSKNKEFADKESVDLRYYSIIYNLIDDIKAALSGMLSPILREEYLGSVSIRQIFNITKVGKVAGSFVTKGIVKKGSKVRLIRDNVVIHEGKLKTLRRFKDDVKEVKENFECGIAFENYDDIRENDTVEVFDIIEEKQVL